MLLHNSALLVATLLFSANTVSATEERDGNPTQRTPQTKNATIEDLLFRQEFLESVRGSCRHVDACDLPSSHCRTHL